MTKFKYWKDHYVSGKKRPGTVNYEKLTNKIIIL